MKAAFKVAKELFEIRDIDMPVIEPGYCVVKIHYCAICAWGYEEWLRDGPDDGMGAGITGHEMSGVITEVGEGVSGWKVGDEVVTYAIAHCGTCEECLSGRTMYCRGERCRGAIGGYVEFMTIAEQCLLPMPKGVDLKHASLVSDMVGTPMHAIRRAFECSLPRDAVSVWGLGPVGMFAVQGLRTFDGVGRIIAVDPVESRRTLALEFGADIAIDPMADGAEDALRSENDGRGLNYAFNCALKSPEMAYNTLSVNGYLMNITGGYPSQKQTEKRVDGSNYFFKGEYEENVRLVEEGLFKLEPVVSHEFPLSQINEAMELRANHPQDSLKVIINCAAE